LQHGKTLGCFYIESPAMRGLLRKLQCNNYKTLVAASSIIRPGVAKSGMMTEYVFRHNNPTKFEYFHPVFEQQLGDTYGVMVYQEDVIKIAHHFAGLDLADADILRRAMSGKTRSKKEFDGVKERFFENCKLKGYSDQLSNEVYRQIESFAGYSFCKAHSASYAVESYQSLYLKVYYPIEFMVAVINNFGGFYRTEVYVHEARMAGATICNPCINKSEYLTTLYDKQVYLGFMLLKSLDAKIAEDIANERKKNGDFTSLENFINRMSVGIETLQLLIFSGAFRFTGKSKNELTLAGRILLVNFKPENRNSLLIDEPTKEYKLPNLTQSPFEDAFDEIELLGFSVSFSPFQLLQTKYRGDVMTTDFSNHQLKVVRMVGFLVSIKHVPTNRGTMNFGTWFDIEGNHFDTAHFSDSLKKYPFSGGGCYLLQGKVQLDFKFPTVIIEKMARLPYIPDPRYEDDKDLSFKIYKQIKTDISTTQRAAYPSANEIGLPRNKMKSL
jgi:DNA polymerase-3 subunit alpha/error-prone DNA polymerase